MTATPRTMARQIRVSQEFNAEAARRRNMTGSRLAYTSFTGQVKAPERVEIWDDYCFICSRCTDHAGEHYDVAEVSTHETDECLSHDGTILYVTHTTRTMRAEGPGMPWEEWEKRM